MNSHTDRLSRSLSQNTLSEESDMPPLHFYDFYENLDPVSFQNELIVSELAAREILDGIFDVSFDIIMANYYKSKIPEHVNRCLLDKVELSLECNYKTYDHDDDDDLKNALDMDDKPVCTLNFDLFADFLGDLSIGYLGKSKA